MENTGSEWSMYCFPVPVNEVIIMEIMNIEV